MQVSTIQAAVVEAFLAHSSDLMLLVAADGTILWASPSARRLGGADPADLVGRNGLEMIHPDDQARALAAFARMGGLGDQVVVEMRIVDLEGRVRWVEEVVTNLLDEPEVGAYVGHLRDITERRAVEAQARFQASLLDAVGQSIIARDIEGRTIYWNEGATALFGWTAAEAIGRTLGDLLRPIPEHHDRAVAAGVENAAARTWAGEITMLGRGGRRVALHTTCTPVFDDQGRHLGTIAASTDMTRTIEERHRTEADRRRLAEAQASAHLGSFELDLRTGELVGSDELWRILGREPCGLERLEHVHPDDLPVFRDALAAAAAGRTDVSCTHRIVRPNGEVRWVVSRSGEVHRPDADIVAGTVLDITERHEAEQALRHQATHDPLTGLANRRLFVQELERLLDGAEGGAVVLFVDLDDFKVVNDRVGHVDGDAVLGRVGERIVQAAPGTATVGRIGGDEFVVCFAGGADDEVAAVVAAVRAAIRRPLAIGDAWIAMDASIGVARSDGRRAAEAVLRNADAAMYAAKQAGGGRAEVFDDELHRAQERRRSLVEELRGALDAGQVVPHFQPELDLATGALFGFEALARWSHPERGVVPPDEFIPLAEESGLIADLGLRMLDGACAALAGWREVRPDLPLTVGVNVSPGQLADPSFVDDVRTVLARHAVGCGQLCLEVTESMVMDPRAGTDVIRALRDLGVLIAIDDFGTGYSSFGRLKHLVVDFLKIDRSFVADIGRPADELILTTMVDLARSLGVEVISEGIETEGQHAFLAAAGCRYGQGYLWSRPLPLDEVTALVAAQPGQPAG